MQTGKKIEIFLLLFFSLQKNVGSENVNSDSDWKCIVAKLFNKNFDLIRKKPKILFQKKTGQKTELV